MQPKTQQRRLLIDRWYTQLQNKEGTVRMREWSKQMAVGGINVANDNVQ